ncbi:MAG: nucleotide exchange factor GrpE [Thaumarchaeota archaeon]|nr:nucleotide exchange factor GrpE [Nitrososphaerota archaeon]
MNNDENAPVDLNFDEANESQTTLTEKLKNSTNMTKLKSYESSMDELKMLLDKEKKNLTICEERLKRSLADYQNLERKTKSDIENNVNIKIDKFMVSFLQIYDDLVRAKNVLANEKINVEGLEGILRNMNSLLEQYDIVPIDALGEIFNPNLHEAISIIEDETIDEDTITKEVRKGYISHNRIIRPAIVEISKKPKFVKLDGEENG